MKTFLMTTVLLAGSLHAAVPVKIQADYDWMTDKTFVQRKQTAIERSKRSIASGLEVNDSLMSKEYKAFRKTFLEIKTPQELDKQLEIIEANYDRYPDDMKLIVAVLSPMRVMRAFTYKVYPLVTQEKVAHSAILTRVLNFAAFMKINLPTDQWNAGFKYLTEPMMEDDLARINSPEELQAFVGTKLYPAFLKASKRINAIDLGSNPVVWDNKLLYGTGSFQDNFKRYQLVGEAERLAVLAGIHASLGDMARFQAYNVDQYLSLTKDLSSLYGYDSMFSPVDGLTAQKVQHVFMKPKYRSLFTLRENGEGNLQASYRHTKESTRLFVLAWQELKNRDSNDLQVLRSAMVMPFSTEIDKSIEASEKMISERTTVRSEITGEMITVDLPALYNNPPRDLKAFLPTGFDQSNKTLTHKVQLKSGKTKDIVFRNYFHGRPTQWNAKAYSTLFPDVKKDSDVPEVVRVLNQATGSGPVAASVNFFMLYN